MLGGRIELLQERVSARMKFLLMSMPTLFLSEATEAEWFLKLYRIDERLFLVVISY